MAGSKTIGPGLRKALLAKVFGGRQPFQLITMTTTGTGLGSATYRIGQLCLDSSANNWFLCTATAGTGTWVQINA